MEFKNESELVEWVYDMHLQNTNGRESHNEMFKLGIEAAIEELKELKLLNLPDVSFSEAECKHEFVSREYMNQPNGTCLQCGDMIP